MTSIWEISPEPVPTPATLSTSAIRTQLQLSQDYLKARFDQGAEVSRLVYLRAHFIDQVLQTLWQQHIAEDLPVALVAVGGYGRGELHPYSDVDVLILLDDTLADAPPPALADLLTQLWDVGLEIGHSVRTLQECKQLAQADITIATNLLEIRSLCGSQLLFEQLEQLTVTNKTWDTRRFYELKKQEQEQRHQKYNDTANNLEPNLKEAPGGLRDIQVISWVAQQHFGVKNLKGLNEKGFLAQSEYDLLQKAGNFLWKVRFALHHLAGRKQEKLLIDYQRELAKQLGYQDSDNRLAVEEFMQHYYRCARMVGQMNGLLLQLFEENIILTDEPRHITPFNQRFQAHNGYLETINPGIFAYYPYAMLELFLILQQHPELKGLRAATIRQIHAHLHLIDENFRADSKNCRLFMEIIRQPQGVTHEFRRMNKLGLLGAYLTEFGQIVGQMQHDLFHAYTVDEHTLFLVRNLRRFSCTKFNDEFPLCSQIFHQLAKPELLYIAGIYHDIAKGRGGDHSVLGVVDARAFCQRHSLSNDGSKIIAFLIRNHLVMSATAQRSDIDDPHVIQTFANLVQTTERLNYLYLLTVADIRATNNNLWNSWRDSLLKQLYHSTRQWIEHSEVQAKSTHEKSYIKYQAAIEQLEQAGWSPQQITALWDVYEPEYFLRHSIDEIVWQTEQRLHNLSTKTLIKLRPHNKGQTLEVFIFTADRPGLFAAIAACLEQLQLDVLDAKINSTTDGHILHTFIVKIARQNYNDILTALDKQLQQSVLVKAQQPAITPRVMQLFKTQPTIHFATNQQQNHTVMELRTHDRPKLVSTVAQVFLVCHIQLINAKLTTLGDQVEDVFFITLDNGDALDQNAQTKLEQQLIERLST